MTESEAVPADEEAGVDPERVEHLFVRIDGDRYALERGRLQRVAQTPAITPVPRTPEIVRGVTQIGGTVTAVVDTWRTFDRPARPIEKSRLLVLEQEPDGNTLGFPVDAVETFAAIDVSRIDLDASDELVRAVIQRETETDAHPGSDERAAGADESIPIVDVSALFEVATV